MLLFLQQLLIIVIGGASHQHYVILSLSLAGSVQVTCILHNDQQSISGKLRSLSGCVSVSKSSGVSVCLFVRGWVSVLWVIEKEKWIPDSTFTAVLHHHHHHHAAANMPI